ncbi:hypothetical protein ACFL5V_10960 [Fibrobacterota bacterium]
MNNIISERKKPFPFLLAISLVPVLLWAEPRTVNVTGEVVITDEDEKDNHIELAITVEQDEDCEYYFIVLDKKGRELIDVHGDDVTVRGTVQRKDGIKWLTVKEWKYRPTPCNDESGPPTDTGD